VKYPCEAIALSTPDLSADAKTPAAKPGWILTATILGSSMAFIDGTVVNVALPNLQGAMHATVSGAQWIVESYALFLAALLLVGGKAGDVYGRRRVFGLGVSMFAAASAWCGFAPEIHQLILARGFQGIGGAMLVPGSLAIISATFPPERRGKAIGTWSGFTGITAAMGPVLGGWLVEHLSWRWVFFINLPLAAAVLVILSLYVPESRSRNDDPSLDSPGATLITFALGTLVFAMIEAPNLGWTHPLTWGGVATGTATILMFVFRESRTTHPLLPLCLFHSRNFTGANLLTLLLYAALGALLFFLPFDLIQVQGYSPTKAGAANLPFILALFVLSPWAGDLVARYSAKTPLVIGPLITAVGFILFARPAIGGSYWTTFFPAALVLGLGMSGVVAPLTTTVMGSVGPEQAGVASGVNNAVSRLASLLSIAVLGLIALHVFGIELENRVDAAGVPRSVRNQVLEQSNRLTQIQIPPSLDQTKRHQLAAAIQISFVRAFRAVMLVCAVLAVLSAITAWALIDSQPLADKRHTKLAG
jgi:EmrB/QacA subfamily drug resistance transporter